MALTLRVGGSFSPCFPAWKQRGSDTRKLDYMKLLLAELDRRGWSHEAKMALLWFIEGVMHIADEDVWEDGGRMHAA